MTDNERSPAELILAHQKRIDDVNDDGLGTPRNALEYVQDVYKGRSAKRHGIRGHGCEGSWASVRMRLASAIVDSSGWRLAPTLVRSLALSHRRDHS